MNNNQSCAPNQIAKYNASKMCKINNPQTIVPAENSYLKVKDSHVHLLTNMYIYNIVDNYTCTYYNYGNTLLNLSE